MRCMNDDLSRQDATTPDSEYVLTIEGALVRYEHAGYPCTPRSERVAEATHRLRWEIRLSDLHWGNVQSAAGRYDFERMGDRDFFLNLAEDSRRAALKEVRRP